jgi:glutaredoxin 3
MTAEIKVYSTQTCPYCNMLKTFFNEKKIKFENVDVGVNRDAAMEMIRKSGQMGVPQTEINGKMIIGFDKAAIEAELSNMASARVKVK